MEVAFYAIFIYQVMRICDYANHFHSIIQIILCRDRSRPVPTENIKIKSLSSLISAFKTTSSKKIHNLGCNHFLWQRSFYDRIIRNEKEYYAIRQYIRDNPVNWEEDSNHEQDFIE